MSLPSLTTALVLPILYIASGALSLSVFNYCACARAVLPLPTCDAASSESCVSASPSRRPQSSAALASVRNAGYGGSGGVCGRDERVQRSSIPA